MPKQSDTYDAVVHKAFELSGSLKIFKLDEDLLLSATRTPSST